MLRETTAIVVENLELADSNQYPVEEAEREQPPPSSDGIGVQGMADVFMRLGIEYESDAAKALNARIFAEIYHAAVGASVALARAHGPHESFRARRPPRAASSRTCGPDGGHAARLGRAGRGGAGARLAQQPPRRADASRPRHRSWATPRASSP